MKRSRGISPASKEQRAKVRERCCLNCGRDRAEAKIDPAHLWPRGKGGCDHADCVVPLCRQCHRLYDEGKLDLLPILIAAGCWREMAHAVEPHEVSPTVLLQQLTGVSWTPLEQKQEAASPASKGAVTP